MKVFYTVPSETSRVAYSGNGSTTVFSTSFVFIDDTDLVVTLVSSAGVETVKTLTTHYTVTGGEGANGSVTMLTAPASGETLVIERQLPFTQEIDYQDNDGFPAAVNEEGLDRNTMLAAQAYRRAQQGPKLPATYDITDDPVGIPMPENGKLLSGKTDETGWENVEVADLELADIPVLISGVAEGDPLIYDSGAAVWKNNKNLITNRVAQTQSGTGGATRLLSARLVEFPITPQDFGAVGDGVVDDATALTNWFAYVSANRLWGHVPKGRYRCASQLNWNLDSSSNLANYGFQITTAGPRNAVIVFDTATTSPNLTIRCTGVTNSSFYFRLLGLGVEGNVNGKLVMIGDASLTGAFNSCVFDINALNGSTGGSAIAIECNYIVASDLIYTANGGGTAGGIAVKMNQVNGCNVYGQHGNAATGLYMTGDTYGNVFVAPLFEVLTLGLKIDHANTFSNTFQSGIVSQNTDFIRATNGSNNIVDGVVWDGLNDFFDSTNYTGIRLRNQRDSLLSTPAVGASPFSWTNNCGQDVMAYITGGTVSAVVVDGDTLAGATEVSVRVPATKVITITYSSLPALKMQTIP